jgi:formylglycine-generating enzyme required for sulfatase activity
MIDKLKIIQITKCVLILTLLIFSENISANDIRANNITTIGHDVSSGVNHPANSIKIQFDLNWKNSWKITDAPNNWDAAWVYVKYRVGNSEWQHAYFNDTGHLAPTGSQIDLGLKNPATPFNAFSNPAIGVFIRRSDVGNGFLNLQSVQLQWNYRANPNLLVNDNDKIDIRIFGVEMVYVPEGTFAVGSGEMGTTSQSEFIVTTINTSDATVTPTGVGSLGGEAGGYPRQANAGLNIANIAPPDSASWPNGYKAFYCMKYSISQKQYVDFLNTLTRVQQNNRTETDLSAGVINVTNRYVMTNTSTMQDRNAIRCDAVIDENEPIHFYCDQAGMDMGDYPADGRWIACNWLNALDIAAFLDWSGLRPMTELEYEKACRGPLPPFKNEFAWGDSTITTNATNITDGGEINETTNTIGANAVLNLGVPGPMRVGVFAKANTNRVEAGASYYGIMELSGNVYERAVSIAHVAGRRFTGKLGDGTISTSGNANEYGWNLDMFMPNGEITNAGGMGHRGGAWDNDIDPPRFLRVSNRAVAALSDLPRRTRYGGRGVRSVP